MHRFSSAQAWTGLGTPDTSIPRVSLHGRLQVVSFHDDPETSQIQMVDLVLLLQRQNPKPPSPCKAPKYDFKVICGWELSP